MLSCYILISHTYKITEASHDAMVLKLGKRNNIEKKFQRKIVIKFIQ